MTLDIGQFLLYGFPSPVRTGGFYSEKSNVHSEHDPVFSPSGHRFLRIRQIEAKALERIRFHERAKQLRSY